MIFDVPPPSSPASPSSACVDLLSDGVSSQPAPAALFTFSVFLLVVNDR